MKRKLSNKVLNINQGQGQNTSVKVPPECILYVTPKHSSLRLKCLVITHLSLDKLMPIGSGSWIKCQVQQNAVCSLQRWEVYSFWSSLTIFEGNEMSFVQDICTKSPHTCFLKVLLVHLVSLRSDETTEGYLLLLNTEFSHLTRASKVYCDFSLWTTFTFLWMFVCFFMFFF